MEKKVSFIKTFKPHEKAPEFIKADVIINIDEFAQMVKSGENISTYEKDGKSIRQIKLQLLEAKDGGYYFQFNNYKKQ